MVSMEDQVCQLCIGCSLPLSNNGTKLCVIRPVVTDTFFIRPLFAETLYVRFVPAIDYLGIAFLFHVYISLI
jgi:hypothetical protein